MPKESHRSRPMQTAKRKQQPLGQEELLMRKKSKTTEPTTNEEDETIIVLDEHEDLTPFISPEKHHGKGLLHVDEAPKVFVSPLKYMYLADGGEERSRTTHKKLAKKQGDQEANSKSKTRSKRSGEKELSTRASDNVEESNETPSDRFVRSAQEDLIQMIEEGAGDTAIENQLKIIKMLRTRLPSQADETRRSSAQDHQSRKDHKVHPQPKAANKDVPEPPRPKSGPRHPHSIPSNSDSDSDSNSNVSTLPVPPPDPKKRTRNSSTKAKSNRETKELLKTARPASAPTSLPATQRTNKSLTTEEVAKLSTVHPSFNQKETNRFDRHTRKINATKGMASDRPAIPARGLESRIRAPTSSPEVEPRRSTQYRLDAAALRAVESATAAASPASANGQQPSSAADRAIPVNAPGKGKARASASPGEFEESVRTLGESLGPRQMPARRAATLGGRPGQVWNEDTKRWQYQYQYVEEVDSDDD